MTLGIEDVVEMKGSERTPFLETGNYVGTSMLLRSQYHLHYTVNIKFRVKSNAGFSSNQTKKLTATCGLEYKG